MEDRMLSDEVLLALINKKGGGGGTSNYNQLENKPQINGVTLSGDKSASDLSLASLDANGKVPAAQLPSYVDDVINGYLYEGHFYEDSEHQTEITGESGKIYIDLETNKTYRWSGLAFVEISESLALGETASTAYAGDKGKANADAINAIKDGQTIDSFADVESALADKVDKVNGKGLSTNDYTDADKAIVGGVTAALDDKVDKVDGKGLSSNDFTDEYKTAIGANTTAISGIKNGVSINSFGGVETALADKADKSALKNEFIGTTAQWNALTTAQKKEYDTYQLTDDYTEGGSGLPDYSTTEQLTGQKWIDGSPIYFKTINFGSLPDSTYKTLNTGLANVKIIKMEGIAISSDYAIPLPEPSANNQNAQLYYEYANNNITIATGGSFSGYTEAYVVLYYTKTA